ncbi:hypothetical protein HY624_00665 [Candidatus Uhrbacteria bacterium]|nr:hypothetical protein [Candidatus Uhrbacteria bacterium]
MRYQHYFFLSFMAFGIVFIANSGFAFAAGVPKPQKAPPYVHPNAGKSPAEIIAENQKKLDGAIKKRQKKGLSVDPDNVRLTNSQYDPEFKAKPRYTKQSCYHMTGNTDPDEFVFCDAEKCTFPDASSYPDGGYCEFKTRDCYDRDGQLILNEQGISVTDSYHAFSVKWDMCLQQDGSLVTPPGEQSFDEKIKTGCAYRVRSNSGYNGYMMTCDQYRCLFHPGAGTYYDRETKMFVQGENASKTPPYEYVPYLDSKCLDRKAVDRIAMQYRCGVVIEDETNWGCRVYFKNGKHNYDQCVYRYNEKGEPVERVINIIPELQEQLDAITQVRYQLMDRNRVDIVRKMGELEGIFHMKPATDAIQKKAIAAFAHFFERKENGTWTNAQLGRELAVLWEKIRRLVKVRNGRRQTIC